MANVDWRLTGPEISTCNCYWGCPCQFNSRPSFGHCDAVMAMRIDRGHFGDVALDGVKWAGVYRWPRAIHEGNGEAMVVIGEGADERQRSALRTILAGKETEPGATVFNVFAATFTKVHKPVVRPIAFEVDLARCTGSFAVEGMFEATAGPIANPVTGAQHRATLSLPGGFEFQSAEFASSTARAQLPVVLQWEQRHAHLAMLDIGPRGPIRR
jgi:hypothetical protein